MTEKKTLYFAIAFLQAFISATWMQLLYNDPGIIKSKDPGEWCVIFGLTLLNALLAGCICLKAYTSDPNNKPNVKTNETKPTPTVPPAPVATSGPAGDA